MNAVCQAKQPSALLPRMWVICGEPATMTGEYRCACGHARQGSTCDAHPPVSGEVGCARCWDEGHDCPMTFEAVGR